MKNTHAVLLVVLVLTPGPGGSPGPALAQLCSADSTITGHDDVAEITSVRTETTTYLHVTLYVNPEPDFKGVTLVVEALGSGGVLYEAWFPLEDKCFQGSAVWWKVKLQAWVSYYNGKHELSFQVANGECSYACVERVTFGTIRSLLVKGHGTSQWRSTYPHTGCGTLSSKERTSLTRLPSCSAPPPPRPDNTSRPTPTQTTTTAHTTITPPTTTTPPATTTAHTTITPPATTTPLAGVVETKTPSPQLVSTEVVAAVVVAIVVVGVIVVVVIMCVIRRARATTDVTMRMRSTETSPAEHVVINSLYEPFENFRSLN